MATATKETAEMEKLKESNESILEGLIPIGEMKEILYDLIPMTPRRSLFMWGPPGIGKSSVVGQVGNDIGYDIRPLSLADRDSIDFRGSPVPTLKMKDGSRIYLLGNTTKVDYEQVEAGITEWFIPGFLAISKTRQTILFLDEFNQGDKQTQKVAQRLVLEYRLDEYVLPDTVRIVAAGNRETDKAFVQRLSAPTNNRFIHFEVGPDYDGWVNWAVLNDLHPFVIAYIRHNPKALFNFNPTSNDKAFPTPRSWEAVSDVMKNYSRKAGLFWSIMGCVGKSEAIAFKGFMDLFSEIPDLDDIFKNPNGTKIPSNPSVRFSICILLARKSTYKNLAAIKTYVERMGREYCVYTINYITALNDDLAETPEYVMWAHEYQDFLVDERSLKKPKKKGNN